MDLLPNQKMTGEEIMNLVIAELQQTIKNLKTLG